MSECCEVSVSNDTGRCRGTVTGYAEGWINAVSEASRLEDTR